MKVATGAGVPCENVRNSDSDLCCRTTTSDSPDDCHCLSCCYATVTPMRNGGGSGKASTTATNPVAATAPVMAANAYDHDGVPSEATAFVASASAAALVLLAALLAVVLSSAALWTVVSMVPMADAATNIRVGQPQAADYLYQWHSQQRLKRQQPYPWHVQRQPMQRQSMQRQPMQRQPMQRQPMQRQPMQRRNDDNASRLKRQLFKKSSEPGVIALAFNLIGGTVSDVREAYRNVTGIVRNTLNEAARPVTTTAAADGDQMMMAAGNTVENEVGGSTTTAAVSTADQKAAGDRFGRLFGRNYRGLRRLFNSELRSALKNSPGNIRDFTVELVGSIGQSLRPSRILTRGPINDGPAPTTTR